VQPTADAMGRRKLLIVTAYNLRELDELFPSLVRQGADTLVVRGSPLAYGWREQLAALAARYSIPAIYPTRDNVEAGGLMSCGINVNDRFVWSVATPAAFSRGRSLPTCRCSRRPSSSCHQSQGGQGARPRNSTDAARPGRRDDRVAGPQHHRC
jgi:hypothetical protein